MATEKALDLFTIGAGKAIPVNHVGPKSYTTNGETYGTANNQTGITVQGLATLTNVIGGPANSGNYFVYAVPQSTGESKTFKLVWVTATAGVPTTTQATSLADLSAETVRLLVIGR